MKNRPLLPLLFLLLGFSFEVFLFSPLRASPEIFGKIGLKLKFNANTSGKLTVIGTHRKDYSINAQGHEPHEYIFDQIPAKFDFLALSFLADPNSKVELFEFSFLDAEGIKQILPLKKLAEWKMASMRIVELDDKKIMFKLDSTNSSIYRSEINNKHTEDLVQNTTWKDSVLKNLSLLLSVLLLARLAVSPQGRTFITYPMAFSAIFFLLAPTLIFGLEHVKFPLQNPSNSIGSALYFGHSKGRETVQIFITLMFSTLCGYILAHVNRSAQTLPHNPVEPSPKWQVYISIFFMSALFIAFNFPDLLTALNTMKESPLIVDGFDTLNISSWSYLSLAGFLPYRDFWFPYGADFLEIGIAPQSLLWRFKEQLITFAVVLYILFSYCGRRIIPACIIIITLGIFIDLEVFLATGRYLLCFTLVGFFYSIASKREQNFYIFSLFGIYAAWCLVQDPVQIMYATPALMLSIYFCFKRSARGAYSPTLLKACACALISFVTILVGFLASLYRMDGLHSYMEFYLNLHSISVSSSTSSPIYDWSVTRWSYDSLLFYGLNLLTFIAVFHLANEKHRLSLELGEVIAPILVLSVLVFQKALIRQQHGQDVLCLIFLGLVLHFLFFYSSLKKREQLIFSVLCGMLMGSLYSSLYMAKYLEFKMSLARNIFSNLAVAINHPIAAPEVIDRYYSSKNLAGIDLDHRLALEYLEGKGLTHSGSEIFVLGDNSYYYPALNQIPCPYISLYDSSGIRAQQAQVQCLRERSPKFIIWDSSFKIFDDVPHTVRVPLIFDYVVEHYVPQRKFGSIYILSRRLEGEREDFEFWTEQLGTEVNQGAVPFRSNISRFKNCESDSCFSFVRIDGSITGITVKVDGKPFTIKFNKPNSVLINEPDNCSVLLDRLWFFSAAKRLGSRIEVLSSLSQQSLVIEKKESGQDILY